MALISGFDARQGVKSGAAQVVSARVAREGFCGTDKGVLRKEKVLKAVLRKWCRRGLQGGVLWH